MKSRSENDWNLAYGGEAPALVTGAAPGVHRSRTVLAVADEWFPSRGGLSSLNRYLCIAMATAGAQVYCLLPGLSEDERQDAERAGVRPVIALRAPGMSEREALLRKPPLPPGVRPDLIIGHGRVTGPIAKSLAEDHFGGSARLHLVHMDPDEIEWYKLDRENDAGTRAEVRSRIELDLAASAAAAVPVGPRLHRWLERDLDEADGVRLIRLDPGFDVTGPPEQRPPGGDPLIMIMGRMEDVRLKGVKLAAKAIGHARTIDAGAERWRLLVRGTPASSEHEMREKILRWIGHRTADVTVRPFSAELGDVRRDLRRASLVLMPSLVEGYGLVGQEAITAGTPALVSARSGLGMLLEEVVREHARRMVVPVLDDTAKDAAVWGHRIAAELADRPAAFARAAAARHALATKLTWSSAAGRLLELA